MGEWDDLDEKLWTGIQAQQKRAAREKRTDDKPLAAEVDREVRLAARAYFRAAPPYRIQFERSGKVSLRRKRYEFMEEADPKTATKWDVISDHKDLEEAERRLRHVTSADVYYDKRGRVTHAPAEPEEEWGVPEDDE